MAEDLEKLLSETDALREGTTREYNEYARAGSFAAIQCIALLQYLAKVRVVIETLQQLQSLESEHKHEWVAMYDKAWNYRKCQTCGETEAY